MTIQSRNTGIDRRLVQLDRLIADGRPRSQIEQLAIQRQVNDLQHGHERGLYWDEGEAQRCVHFFGLLKHWKGEFSGRSVVLEPWQEQCFVAPLMGWYRLKSRADGGIRRFTRGYSEIPRKNGKTTLGAGFALQGLIADFENGAECYSAATKRDQASILFRDAKNMLGPALLKTVQRLAHAIVCQQWNGFLQPLSADYNSMDGLNVSRGIVDELHAHKTRDLYDVLLTAMGARAMPLLLAITTAGYDRSSICWEQREVVRNILEGHSENDSYFGFITTIDDGDDWADPHVWWKANPNLHISLRENYLADLCQTAKDSPAAENNFRRKHLNQWTEQAIRWIQMDVWDQCVGPLKITSPQAFREYADSLKGQECYAGLDLANTRDVNAFVLAFADGAGGYKLLPFFWTPEDSKDIRGEQDRTQVINWAERGFIETTPGNVTDHPYIRERIREIASQYRILECAFDPWGGAVETAIALKDAGMEMIEFRQTMQNFAAPTKDFERLLLTRKIEHGGHPVLRWMASNVAVKSDPSGNLRPDKENSSDKIDGIVAAIMALGRGMLAETHDYQFQPGSLSL